MNPGIIGTLAAVVLTLSGHGGDLPGVPEELALVPASKFCKVVEDTASGDGRFAVAFAPTGKPVDWDDFKEEDGSYSADPQAAGLANFLVDLKKDRAVALLSAKHFGTRVSYNHERCTVAWSGKGSHLVAMQTWKWYTSHAGVYVLSADGAITGALDLLPIAKEQVGKVLIRDHGIDEEAFKARYSVGLSKPEVTDEGCVSFEAWAEVPKMEDPSVFLSLQFTVRPEPGGKLAVVDLKAEEVD